MSNPSSPAPSPPACAPCTPSEPSPAPLFPPRTRVPAAAPATPPRPDAPESGKPPPPATARSITHTTRLPSPAPLPSTEPAASQIEIENSWLQLTKNLRKKHSHFHATLERAMFSPSSFVISASSLPPGPPTPGQTRTNQFWNSISRLFQQGNIQLHAAKTHRAFGVPPLGGSLALDFPKMRD